MDKNSFDFKTEKTARYFTLGDASQAKFLIIALHGYGQLPSYFLKKFEGIHSDYFVVAPEGLHRFYLNGPSGRVGASWMTKEAREADLFDTSNYLKKLLIHLKGTYQLEKTILLGFSQGGATSARLYSEIPNEFDQLILWASVFPPDIDSSKELSFANRGEQPTFVIGAEDEFFKDEFQSEMIELYTNKGFKTKLFSGTHTIDLATLNQVLITSQNN